MSPEDVNLVLDFMAYCLWRYHKFHVWMLLNGAGQNGKSTLLTLFERLFGSQNVSGESLDRLLNERFAPANLYQKLNYYGGKAAISLVAPCIVVALVVVAEGWCRLSLICTGFDIATIFAKLVN
jgi:hypothetical protein